MTAIVGVAAKGRVWLGADACAANVSQYTVDPVVDPKVFRMGEAIVGYTDSFRLGDLLQFKMKLPDHDEALSNRAYLSTAFVDSLRDCLKSGGYARKENEFETAGQFLIGYRGQLFCVQANYSVTESARGYDAIGCGSSFALGAMAALPKAHAHTRIGVALSVAAEHDAYVMDPFTIIETKARKRNGS